MPTAEILLLAVALSADAFAVSVAAAAGGRVTGRRAAFRLSFHFGLFQLLMPLLGWAAGRALEQAIAAIDHWVAFVLLVAIGTRMLLAGRGRDDRFGARDPSRGFTLMALSTAVSIDALAVGLSIGVLRIAIWKPVIIIGAVAAAASLAGILLGRGLRRRLGRVAEILGGAILILIAVRIVVSHLTAP